MRIKPCILFHFCTDTVVYALYIFPELIVTMSLPSQHTLATQHFIFCAGCYRKLPLLLSDQFQHIPAVPIIRP